MAKGHFTAKTATGEGLSSGPCDVDANDKGIAISSPGEPPIYVPYQEAVRLEGVDYAITVDLEDGARLEISRLGSMFGELLIRMRDARNEVWERGLFLHGVKRIDAFPCEVAVADGTTSAEVRLYEDRFSVLPERGDPLGFPYALVQQASFDETRYRITVGFMGGEALEVGGLKQRTREFANLLNDLLAGSRKRTASILAEYLPGLPPLKLQAMARLLGDGVAARRADIDTIDETAWGSLEKIVAATPQLMETYRFLESLSSRPDTAIGLKQLQASQQNGSDAPEGEETDSQPRTETSATSATTEESVINASESDNGSVRPKSALVTWFLCPIHRGAGVATDFIAQEITSEEGHATYLYRADRSDWKEAITRLNRAMLALDFKRRPIFQNADEVGRDPHWFAMRHLPYLRDLRASFAGRAIHTSLDSWKTSVQRILAGAGQ